MKRALAGSLTLIVLGCAGGGGGSGVCAPGPLGEAVREGNPKVGDLTAYACKEGHAVARAAFDCTGCEPHVDYFLARKGDGWEVIGAGKDLDDQMCEENRAMPYDDCVALFAAFEKKK